MAKLTNPWKCDNPACGKLREADANHWWILGRLDQGITRPYIVIAPWDQETAELASVKHGCGVDCTMKIAARMMDQIIFEPAADSTKETLGDA